MLTTTLAAALLAAGCDRGAARPVEKRLPILLIGRDAADPAWPVAAREAREFERSRSGFIVTLKPCADIAEQRAALDEVTPGAWRAVCVWPYDAPPLAGRMGEILRQGTPVVALVRDPGAENRSGFCGVEPREAGAALAAALIAGSGNAQLTVGLIHGDSGGAEGERRAAFLSALIERGGVDLLRGVPATEPAAALLDAESQRYPRMDAWAMTVDEGPADRPEKQRLVSAASQFFFWTDSWRDLERLRSRTATGVVTVDYAALFEQGLRIAESLTHGESLITPERFVATRTVTRAGLKAFEEEMGRREDAK